MKKSISMIISVLLVMFALVPSISADNSAGFLNAISTDSGYTFGEDADFEVRFITENARSADGVVEFVVTEHMPDGSDIMTFVKPYFEENGALHQMTIPEYDAKVNSRAPINEFNIIKGDVNVYLRAYYTSTVRNGWGGRFFRPVSVRMKCTFSSGTVTSAKVGLGLKGELYDLDTSSTVPLNDDYEYVSTKSLGSMVSGVEKSATVTSLPTGQYVYVGSGATTGSSCFAIIWEFNRNGTEYYSLGNEVIYSQSSAG